MRVHRTFTETAEYLRPLILNTIPAGLNTSGSTDRSPPELVFRIVAQMARISVIVLTRFDDRKAKEDVTSSLLGQALMVFLSIAPLDEGMDVNLL